ncbi:MAG TPA: helix-turn-helix domain-containing protein, partial [Wenzhouxiangella sp.]|nr:helix-turn-helix domain-containing protein [Wenzhouxiangella sp.]
ITLPPLRARREDIMPLAEAFAIGISRELGRELFAGFSPDVQRRLQRYDWPGNIRELKNVVERAVYRHEGGDRPVAELVLDPFDSPWRPDVGSEGSPGSADTVDPARAPMDLRAYLSQKEKEMTERALRFSGGHQGKAAERLGLSYDQLRGILKKHDLGA